MKSIGAETTIHTTSARQRRITAEALINRTQTLSVAPPVAFQLIRLTRSHDYSCEALVDLVSLDPDLTAQILRLCNSVYFRGRRVSSLREAVLRIGNGEIAQKAMSLTFGRLLGARKTAYCPDPNALWRHSVQCGLACRYLNRFCEGQRWDPDLSFTAGLLHDIGKMVINAAPRADLAHILKYADEHGHSMADAELEVLGADHAEIGGLILEHWHVPAQLARAVRYHHTPEFDRLGLANLIHVANRCANVNAGSKEWDDFEAGLQPYVLEHLRLSLPRVKTCWEDMLHDMDAIENFMWS